MYGTISGRALQRYGAGAAWRTAHAISSRRLGGGLRCAWAYYWHTVRRGVGFRQCFRGLFWYTRRVRNAEVVGSSPMRSTTHFHWFDPIFVGAACDPLDVIRCHWMSLDVTGLTVFGILWAYYWHTDHGPPCTRRCRMLTAIRFPSE